MLVATAKQMCAVDLYLIHHGYTIEGLVEIASSKLYEELSHFHHPYILVGPGNNGADALSLARRFIHDHKAVTLQFFYEDKLNDVERSIYKTIQNHVKVVKTLSLKDHDVIIDGVFGNGLDRPLESSLIQTLQFINSSPVFKVTIDMPTGINASKGRLQEVYFKAHQTISFMCYKLAFLQKDLHFGDIVIKTFGIEDEALENVGIAKMVDHDMIISLLKTRHYDDHKGVNGKITHFTGSPNYIGAATLACKASVYTGSGIVKVCSYPQVLDKIQMHVLEAVNEVLDEDHLSLNFNDAFLCGCGCGQNDTTRKLLETLIQQVDMPLVLDADALNVLSEDPDILLKKKGPVILTPHLIEFQRLAHSIDDLEKAIRDFADRYDVILVVKGPNTIIYGHHQMYRNITGNPGMAIGGMGDALAGIITSLCGQGYDPLMAACLGVYLHGYCGDRMYEENAFVLPHILVESIPKVLKEWENEKKIQNSKS